jgi:hypothetical protein
LASWAADREKACLERVHLHPAEHDSSLVSSQRLAAEVKHVAAAWSTLCQHYAVGFQDEVLHPSAPAEETGSGSPYWAHGRVGLRLVLTPRTPAAGRGHAWARCLLAQCSLLRSLRDAGSSQCLEASLGTWLHQVVATQGAKGLLEAINARVRMAEVLEATLLLALARERFPHGPWQDVRRRARATCPLPSPPISWAV